jgi:hypothetical protein
MDLRDAVSRGIVLATVEVLAPSGPIELTVDNPTWQPLWLDVPAGSVVSADGRDWVIGLTAPFRMMRKQRTGRTVTAFPLRPPSGPTPKRLAWSAAKPREESRTTSEIALAVQRLQDLSRSRERPAGAFERGQPFDFWPLVVKWSTWDALGHSSREAVLAQVTQLLLDRAKAGDAQASSLDPGLAADEVIAAASEATALRASFQADALPLELQCARACFR